MHSDVARAPFLSETNSSVCGQTATDYRLVSENMEDNVSTDVTDTAAPSTTSAVPTKIGNISMPIN